MWGLWDYVNEVTNAAVTANFGSAFGHHRPPSRRLRAELRIWLRGLRVSTDEILEMRELEGQALPIPAVIRELLWGDQAVLVEMSAPAGFIAEPHAHDHESLVYLLSGRISAAVADETRELGPGDAVLHPIGVTHHIEALVAARWIEIKAPPRATWPTRGPDA